MLTIIKQKYNYLTKMTKQITYQNPFAEKTLCHSCAKEATLMMLIDDDEGSICNNRPENARIWPHDCTAIALYMCTFCGEITAKWNQA